MPPYIELRPGLTHPHGFRGYRIQCNPVGNDGRMKNCRMLDFDGSTVQKTVYATITGSSATITALPFKDAPVLTKGVIGSVWKVLSKYYDAQGNTARVTSSETGRPRKGGDAGTDTGTPASTRSDTRSGSETDSPTATRHGSNTDSPTGTGTGTEGASDTDASTNASMTKTITSTIVKDGITDCTTITTVVKGDGRGHPSPTSSSH